MTPFRRSQGLLLALLLYGCGAGDAPFTHPLVLGGLAVEPGTLNQGREVYTRVCAACHGDEGDGRGPTAASLTIAPRDFTTGLFKYGGVPAGELPTDEDLLRIVRRGLDGTPMLACDLRAGDRQAVVQYLKTFSPRWRDEAAPPRIQPTADPWRARPRGEALRRGATLFHVRAGCARCHGAYATHPEIRAMARALGDAAAEVAARGPFARAPLASAFRAGTEPVRIVPPDLRRDRVRNGTSLEDLYRTIAAGVGGTAMPTWRGSLPEEDLWALVHYTKSLVDRKSSVRSGFVMR